MSDGPVVLSAVCLKVNGGTVCRVYELFTVEFLPCHSFPQPLLSFSRLCQRLFPVFASFPSTSFIFALGGPGGNPVSVPRLSARASSSSPTFLGRFSWALRWDFSPGYFSSLGSIRGSFKSFLFSGGSLFGREPSDPLSAALVLPRPNHTSTLSQCSFRKFGITRFLRSVKCTTSGTVQNGPFIASVSRVFPAPWQR